MSRAGYRPMMVALKAQAGTRQDRDDLRALISRLGSADAGAFLQIVAKVFSDDPLPDRKRLMIEDLSAE